VTGLRDGGCAAGGKSENAMSRRLLEIAGLFLKLGTIGFGGPATHLALMEDEVVHRRGWLSRQHFLDLVGATNLIPGPNSTEMAIHVGFVRGGWAGLVVAGVAFILPATLITTALAWLYVEHGRQPQIEPIIAGIKPAVLALEYLGESSFVVEGVNPPAFVLGHLVPRLGPVAHAGVERPPLLGVVHERRALAVLHTGGDGRYLGLGVDVVDIGLVGDLEVAEAAGDLWDGVVFDALAVLCFLLAWRQ
jgi:hypothetical protein